MFFLKHTIAESKKVKDTIKSQKIFASTFDGKRVTEYRLQVIFLIKSAKNIILAYVSKQTMFLHQSNMCFINTIV